MHDSEHKPITIIRYVSYCAKLHGVISQRASVFVFRLVKTRNHARPTQDRLLCLQLFIRWNYYYYYYYWARGCEVG